MKITLLIALFFSVTVQAQTTVNTAWEKFFKNDRKTARALFTELAGNQATADEANIALCLLAEIDRPAGEVFTLLNKFYNTAKAPEPFIHAMWGSPGNHSGYIKSPAHLDFYKRLSEEKDMDGTLAAMAHGMIGKHFQQIKQIEAADKSYGQLGELENWTITGEYENISTSGFDKSYNVLDHPELNASFTGKNNRRFGWRTVPFLRHDRWFDFTYYNSYKNALQFAQTFVKSPAATLAQIRTGVSGSVKIWVNDKLVLAEAEERNNDLDAYINSIKLNEGYNRIVVQIGESYAGRSNFMIRITDANGHPLKDLTTTTDPQPYTKETSFVSEPVMPKAFKYFQTALKERPDSYLDQLMLAKLYLREGNTFEARSLLEKLKSRFPESSYINLMFIELFSKADNRTGIETAREAIRTNDPEIPFSLEVFYAEYYNQEDYTNAAVYVKKLEAIFGEDESVYLKKINLADKLKNQPEVIELVEKAYPKFTYSADIVGLKYLVEKEIRKNPKSIAIVEKYIRENDDYKSAKFLAQLYFDRGDSDAGLKIYENELKNDPIGFGIYLDLANQYFKLQQYGKAEETYLKALEIDPNHSGTYASLGNVYDTNKQKDKSIAAYKKSLQIDPNNYDAIHSLRRLQDKKSVFEYFTNIDIKNKISEAPGLKEYPDDHVVVLNDEVQKVVYENGGSEEKHFYLAKILTQKGLEESKEYNVYFTGDQNYSIEVAEVIKPNGTKVPAEQNDNQVVFTNMEIGDVINLRYKIQNYFEGSMSSHFWDSFYFSDGLPHVNTTYSLLIHREKPFKYVFSQEEIKPAKSMKDEFDLYVWNKTNYRSLSYEDKMPPMDDVTNKLHISSIPDWQFIADWYNNIATAKARTSYEVKSLVNDLFAGRSSLDQLSKVKVIYDYIVQNIAYSSVSFRQSGIVPQNPSAVLNTRIGDCKDVSTLFVSMCKEAGIQAELALVKTREYGQNTMLLPNIDFNHCIAKAVIDNKDYWVELTSGSLPFNTFNNSFMSSNILEINKSSNKLIKFNPQIRTTNFLIYKTVVKFENSDLIVNETNKNTGSATSYLRAVFSDLSSKDQMTKMKEQLSGEYPENEVYSLSFTNLKKSEANSDTVGTASSYKLINACKPVAGMSIFYIPWSNKVSASQLKIVGPRKFGIDLTQLFGSDESVQELTLELPQGKSIVQPLKPLKISNDFAEFALESVQSGNNLVLKRRFVLKQDFVPLSKVEDFGNFFKQVAEADDQQLAMR